MKYLTPRLVPQDLGTYFHPACLQHRMSTSADAEHHISTGALKLLLGGKSVRLYTMLQCKLEWCIALAVRLY